jgi:putative ABC transport system permease protein
MSASPVRRAVRGAVARRRVQTLVTGLVLLISCGASVLALALVADSSSPFDHAFAAQRGAHLTVGIDPARVTAAGPAAAARRAGVTAQAGPFPTVVVVTQQPGQPGPAGQLPPLTLAGRTSPGGPVDDLTLTAGHWARRPGQLVLASNPSSPEQIGFSLGTRLTVTSAPGHPVLTVVGVASSATGSAEGWVMPAQVAALRAPGAPPSAQLLYRLGDASAAGVAAGARAVRAALPPGAVTGTESYLAARLLASSRTAPFVPFLVAFGLAGLVLSVLIVANVVSGAVVAGYRRTGILKSIGFTPGQVLAAYAGQLAVPSVIGCLGGLAVGNALAAVLLRRTAEVYGVGALGVPVWVDVTVPAAMLALVALAAVGPAVRAARLSAVAAIAAGRAPRAGRGYAAHRLLGRLPVPRPVSAGLAAPFARPSRTLLTGAAVLLGATVVIFAVGLGGSLSRVVDGLTRAAAQPVQVLPGGVGGVGGVGTFSAAQQRAVQATLTSEPGTAHFEAETDQQFTLAGQSGWHPLTAFGGPAAQAGYPLIRGHWYTGPGQADVSTGFLTLTGQHVGGRVTIVVGAIPVTMRIAGEIFSPQGHGISVVTSQATLAAAGGPGLAAPQQYDVSLRPGTSPARYMTALGARLGRGYVIASNTRNTPVVTLMLGLIALLTVALATVAGLGAASSTALHIREKAHDLGVYKAIGMTPGQTVTMVVCWVAGPGLAAGLLAVPAGMALHGLVLPVMAHSANLGLPASYLNVYRPAELAALALAGVGIAVAGALLPAGWAARGAASAALHAE